MKRNDYIKKFLKGYEVETNHTYEPITIDGYRNSKYFISDDGKQGLIICCGNKDIKCRPFQGILKSAVDAFVSINAHMLFVYLVTNNDNENFKTYTMDFSEVYSKIGYERLYIDEGNEYKIKFNGTFNDDVLTFTEYRDYRNITFNLSIKNKKTTTMNKTVIISSENLHLLTINEKNRCTTDDFDSAIEQGFSTITAKKFISRRAKWVKHFKNNSWNYCQGLCAWDNGDGTYTLGDGHTRISALIELSKNGYDINSIIPYGIEINIKNDYFENLDSFSKAMKEMNNNVGKKWDANDFLECKVRNEETTNYPKIEELRNKYDVCLDVLSVLAFNREGLLKQDAVETWDNYTILDDTEDFCKLYNKVILNALTNKTYIRQFKDAHFWTALRKIVFEIDDNRVKANFFDFILQKSAKNSGDMFPNWEKKATYFRKTVINWLKKSKSGTNQEILAYLSESKLYREVA